MGVRCVGLGSILLFMPFRPVLAQFCSYHLHFTRNAVMHVLFYDLVDEVAPHAWSQMRLRGPLACSGLQMSAKYLSLFPIRR